MITKFCKRLGRFARDEAGVMTVPFALWSSVFIGITLSTIEVGAISVRHYGLERALDESVRDVRLNTGAELSHTELKTAICDRATLLPNCERALKLEMVALSFRDWTAPQATADCVDRTDSTIDPRAFETGLENQLMMLRACYKFTPISPIGFLSSALETASDGASAIVSTSAFVQEPE